MDEKDGGGRVEYPKGPYTTICGQQTFLHRNKPWIQSSGDKLHYKNNRA